MHYHPHPLLLTQILEGVWGSLIFYTYRNIGIIISIHVHNVKHYVSTTLNKYYPLFISLFGRYSLYLPCTNSWSWSSFGIIVKSSQYDICNIAGVRLQHISHHYAHVTEMHKGGCLKCQLETVFASQETAPDVWMSSPMMNDDSVFVFFL